MMSRLGRSGLSCDNAHAGIRFFNVSFEGEIIVELL